MADVREDIEEDHHLHSLEDGEGEVLRVDQAHAEDVERGVAEVEYISGPINGQDDGQRTGNRQQGVVEEAEQPGARDRRLFVEEATARIVAIALEH